MELIKGTCNTNLDGYECPIKEFYRVPNKGERVSVWHNGNPSTLKVIQIIHSYKDDRPYIHIELHN